jgi:hypothetical protein
MTRSSWPPVICWKGCWLTSDLGPLVAWEPVYGANEYEVQWSRSLNPWRPDAAPLTTPATAAVLPVKAGRWYYKVRGLNPSLPKKPEMTWSKPVSLRVARPRFRIVKR